MTRQKTLDYLLRVADPILRAAAEDRLRAEMPVEAKTADRDRFTYFEGVSRLLLGMAPWLVSQPSDEKEASLQLEYGELCRKAIHHQLDPNSADHADFGGGWQLRNQLLVDIAFLIQAIWRGREELLDKMDEEDKRYLLNALLECRKMTPSRCNWYLFSGFVEAGIYLLTGTCDAFRMELIFRQLDAWYVGDSLYKDGDVFSMDYYNSFVIHPMLYELAEIFESIPGYSSPLDVQKIRLSRYAAIQERQIAPDGTYIAIGRSITYRCGAFHALSLAAWRHLLPEELTPAQVRCALSAVIERTLTSRSFDEKGFLVIGVCDSQPDLGERYISTGSLYLCSAAFLILGLSEQDEFWSSGDKPWTQQRIWGGENLPADHKITT